jgi:CHAT domain-containing protein
VRFNDERVAIARRMRSGSRAAQALLARAQRYEALGRVALARRDANAAADTFSDSVARAWIDAERHIARGRETIVSSPAQAIAEFDAVLRNRTGRATGYRVVQALLGRADARLAADDVRRAEVDLDSAAGWITRADAEIRRAGYRTSLLETARGLFDRLVMLRLAQGDTAGALCYLERGRVSFAPRRPEATQRPQCAWAVPAGTVALDYAQIGDTLLAWALRPNGVRLVRQTVPAAELAAIGEKARLRLEQRQDAARIRPLLAWLFNRLVKPLDGSLGPRGTRLAVVADGAVPADLFHALFDASRGRYVVEDYVVADVPALRDVHADRSRRRSNGPVLVAADPAFDRAAYPGLDDLPGAEAEADSVERLYGGSVVTMRGAAVTPSAFATALSRASIVHFAGHAEFDDQQPDASVLVLARDGRRRGTLSAAELAGKDLRGVRLVVLSACETLRSGTGRAGGFAGFTQALLGAGVGGVVGGSWKVDDALSRDLMIRFHREYRRTGDAAAALRQAQLELLRSGDPAQATPSTWAAFRYAGN